jgi:hypothetical protein
MHARSRVCFHVEATKRNLSWVWLMFYFKTLKSCIWLAAVPSGGRFGTKCAALELHSTGHMQLVSTGDVTAQLRCR